MVSVVLVGCGVFQQGQRQAAGWQQSAARSRVVWTQTSPDLQAADYQKPANSTPSAVFHFDQRTNRPDPSWLVLTRTVPSIFYSEKAVLLEQR
ncbi:hypothetical protein PDJAM_G00187140 [Pangasius djambal]|uniref:Uncharacterized protein n=1 Tax=Pangasius djambal TaxID=1691987 RepID=A0ACC5Y5R9_9TELE|nr:hypothetical protein [Pangasius djambal]